MIIKLKTKNLKLITGFTLISKACQAFTLISKACQAFTLIELLVVISIIGILMAVSLFGMQGARESSRDARRKSDLEMIRSGLEIYKSDCDIYPATLGTELIGSGSPTSCAATNTYISAVPLDPLNPARVYTYSRITTSTYTLCASLEQTETPYCVTNP